MSPKIRSLASVAIAGPANYPQKPRRLQVYKFVVKILLGAWILSDFWQFTRKKQHGGSLSRIDCRGIAGVKHYI
ncbi:hypothetical protein [Edaphovirga cremea]|uniref:hypothetical protein n=1 Tax=Edaphovirga cremea TaxID=2267246 RepID=UPI0039899076